MHYQKLEEFVLNKLRLELDPRLYYHGIHHTLDVLSACRKIGFSEGIHGDEMILLQTAALFHDLGFIRQYKGHEEVSCQLADDILPGFGYTRNHIQIVNEMIMATRIPQSPKSLLGQIICDADLDYLGRNDFEPIAHSLFKELMAFQLISGEEQWNRIQVSFISNHRYFTQTAISLREEKKQIQLKRLKEIVEAYDSKS
ncbi:MAG TPA: HD domain-containing protein [Bacteroidia bacterium]|nr:HD domain-containing protein [Bacteroidia bacterium]HRS58837.1 HD domain-containing protein [Bacteroidia bacterium]